ncbi:MAG TPA: 50S ribosomal protein L10 [Candidatus Baltobacteraceae bacterium]|jgi:large subunit ribosomal protein L10|nr:50S ribosomal protein L10 [Candidatus Baltobacteraceae bacterium]
MPTAKKAATVEELRSRLKRAHHLILTDPTGLTVEEITKLRGELRKDGTTYAIVKNTLFSIAADDELRKLVHSYLAGATGVIFTGADPVAPAKALKRFEDIKTVGIKAAVIDGKLLDAAQVAVLAELPSRDELRAKVVGILASPLRGIVGVLAANPSGLVRILSAREKQLAETTSTHAGDS